MYRHLTSVFCLGFKNPSKTAEKQKNVFTGCSLRLFYPNLDDKMRLILTI